jgi:hypothetical protein
MARREYTPRWWRLTRLGSAAASGESGAEPERNGNVEPQTEAPACAVIIGYSHLRELESLILRIVKPPGNKQKGKFARSLPLR